MMVPRSGFGSRSGAGAIAAAFLIVGCSGGSSSSDTTVVGTTTVPESESTLPAFSDVDDGAVADCSTRRSTAVPDWPFEIVDLFVPVSATIDGLVYRAEGVTNDAEGVLVTALEETFADLDASEPTGGATDISVDFFDANSQVTLTMVDDDADGCWEIDLVAEYSEQPPTVEQPVVSVGEPDSTDSEATVPAAGPADDGPEVEDPDPDENTSTEVDEPPTSSEVDVTGGDNGVGDTVPPVDPLDQVGDQGRAEVIAARGTFNVGITECSVDPVAVTGVSSTGTLSITGVAPDAVTVTWTYPDGVAITDESSRVLALTPAGGTIIADGVNPDGPETIIVNVACVVDA